jgi:hypothetical protein
MYRSAEEVMPHFKERSPRRLPKISIANSEPPESNREGALRGGDIASERGDPHRRGIAGR